MIAVVIEISRLDCVRLPSGQFLTHGTQDRLEKTLFNNLGPGEDGIQAIRQDPILATARRKSSRAGVTS